MAATTMVLNIYSTIVSWTYLLLIILIVAKVFMWMTGSGVFRGRGGGGDGPRNPTYNPDNPNQNGPRDPQDPDSNNPERGGTTGAIRVQVQDISKTGLPGVLIRVYPQGDRSQNGFIRKFKLAVISAPYQARTDNNGIAEFGAMPSGNVIFELFKEGYAAAPAGAMRFFSVLRGRSRYFWTQKVLVKEQEQIITFTLGREGEEARGYEPHIERAQFTNNNDGQPVVDMTARVD